MAGTQQNAALVEEASAAAQALIEQASSLAQLIARYRVDESVRPAAAPAPLVERRAPNRPMTGRKKPAAAPIAVAQTRAAPGADEWKDF
jgi:methyl-accepting chemotaxis protein